jgi:hypothetical protein
VRKILAAYRETRSIKHAAGAGNCSQTTVYRVLKEYGYEFASTGQDGNRARGGRTDARVRELVGIGLRPADIARELRLTGPAVSASLKRQGLRDAKRTVGRPRETQDARPS